MHDTEITGNNPADLSAFKPIYLKGLNTFNCWTMTNSLSDSEHSYFKLQAMKPNAEIICATILIQRKLAAVQINRAIYSQLTSYDQPFQNSLAHT